MDVPDLHHVQVVVDGVVYHEDYACIRGDLTAVRESHNCPEGAAGHQRHFWSFEVETLSPYPATPTSEGERNE